MYFFNSKSQSILQFILKVHWFIVIILLSLLIDFFFYLKNKNAICFVFKFK